MSSCVGLSRRHLELHDYTGRLIAPPVVGVLLHKGPGPVEVACEGECLLISQGIQGGYKKWQTLSSSQVTVTSEGIALASERVPSREVTLTPLGSAQVVVKQVPYAGSVRVTAQDDGSLVVVNLVDLETYLAGVLPREMPSTWPVEALKAQAVAARTYALERKKAHWNAPSDLAATTADQVYGGWQPLSDLVEDALRQTRGIVMLHEGHLFTAYFHSTCGGRTLDASSVFPAGDAGFIQGVRCGFCTDSRRYAWQIEISRHDLAERLKRVNAEVGEAFRIALERTGGGVARVIVRSASATIDLTTNDFMNLCGRELFYSRRFDVEDMGDRLVIQGQGFGHGVGLCQWGARGMASQGWEYDSILAHYYGDVELARIY
jgi:stage II sporulation protein D